jgi:alcohol dehydrogenase, propanol-preferring
MRAMVLDRPGPIESAPLRLREVQTPAPGPGQVRIQVHCCGVCHTDLHTVQAEISPPRMPLIPGHQIVGVVDALGPVVPGSLLGQRVGVPWLHATCGSCSLCSKGRENLCQAASFTGFDVDGGYAEFVIARADFLVPIPDVLGDDAHVAPLLCAGIIGFRSLQLCHVVRGDKLGIFGFGASAHIVLQIARRRAVDVYVFTRTPKNQQLARSLGARWVGDASDDPGELLDAAISFSPSGQSLVRALERVGPAGVVACAGIYVDRIPELDYRRHLYHEKVLRSVTASTREDAAALMREAALSHVQTDIELADLSEANEVLLRLKQSRIRGGAAVLRIG